MQFHHPHVNPIFLQSTSSLPPPLLKGWRSLTFTWMEIKLGTKIQQITLEFLCLILLDYRTNCLNPNDRNISPNWTLKFRFR